MKTGKKPLNRKVRGIGVGLFIVVCFTVSLHGAARESSLFTWNPGLFNQNGNDNRLFSQYAGFEASNGSNLVHFTEIKNKPKVSNSVHKKEIGLGMLLNIAGSVGGGLIGYRIGRNSGEDEEFVRLAQGMLIGSTLGSALGVYIAGNLGDVKGSLGSALLGSLLGELAATGVSIGSGNGIVAFISFLALPPICSALLFNRSLKYRSLPVTHAVLNFDGDEFKIGIPYFHIRSLPGYAKNVKPKLRFDINLVSIEL